MGGLLLCSSKRGEYPYLVEEEQIGLYSLEEIAFYLYHHIYMIDTDFFSEKFTAYLRKELELDFLAEKIDSLRQTEASLEEYVMLIFQMSNYYHEDEITEFQENLRIFSSLSAEERLKLIGDTYMKDRRLRQALWIYRSMVQFYEKTVMPTSFWAEAFHNIGVCCFSMFYYEEAESCFMKAYGMNSDEMYLKKAALTLYLSGNEKRYGEWKIRHEKEPIAEWEKEWEITKKEAWEKNNREQKTIDMLYETGRMSEFEEQMKIVMDRWKQDYRREME